MIDFTSCTQNKFKGYGGANGNKINIFHEGESYMLKFPPPTQKSKGLRYKNSCISEYIACHILDSIGFSVQDTLLGTYKKAHGKACVVVACKDFTASGKNLMEFAQLKNTCIDSENNGYGTDLESILASFAEQQLLPEEEIKAFFWDMFIADALLGNFDRHNGNWGILTDERTQTAEIAPIYDCGSCLFPQAEEEQMEMVVQDPAQLDHRVFVYPTSAIKHNDKKINYFAYISSHVNPDCSRALARVTPKIDMEKIREIIHATPFISEIQKTFYETIVSERKCRILDHSLAKLPKDLAEDVPIQDIDRKRKTR